MTVFQSTCPHIRMPAIPRVGLTDKAVVRIGGLLILVGSAIQWLAPYNGIPSIALTWPLAGSIALGFVSVMEPEGMIEMSSAIPRSSDIALLAVSANLCFQMYATLAIDALDLATAACWSAVLFGWTALVMLGCTGEKAAVFSIVEESKEERRRREMEEYSRSREFEASLVF